MTAAYGRSLAGSAVSVHKHFTGSHTCLQVVHRRRLGLLCGTAFCSEFIHLGHRGEPVAPE